jgi:hypothetical protein
MLNKVREVDDEKLYEVVEYEYANPSVFTINTWSKDKLLESLSNENRDYSIRDGFLISNAETVDVSPFPEGTLDVVSSVSTVFSLIVKLLEVGSFFIPESAWGIDAEFKGENVSHFSNVRVSNSTMFVGFSLLSGNHWRTSSILSVDENGDLRLSRFYFAVPIGTYVGFGMSRVSKNVVNNVECDVYFFDGDLPLIPMYDPVEYIPKPIINYLFFQQNMFKNCASFVKLFLDELKIEVEGDEVRTLPKRRAVSVVPSIKPTSRQRMSELLESFLSGGSDLEKFRSDFKLNPFETVTFDLLSKMSPQIIDDDLVGLYSALKTKMNFFAVLLMELRCKIFVSDLVLPPLFSSVCASGGHGGFFTTIKRANWF